MAFFCEFLVFLPIKHYIKKMLSIRKIFYKILLMLLLVAFQPATSSWAEPEIIKPQRPLFLKTVNQYLQQAQRSSLIACLEQIIGLTPSINLFFTAGHPRVIIIPALASSTQGLKPGKIIRTITANLLLFPSPFFYDQEERIGEFVKLARSMNPDVIFLQEVWDNKSLNSLIKKFADYHAVLMPNPIFNLSGLLILSRFKINNASAEIFPFTLSFNPEELIARKGILIAEIELNGQKNFLLTTHLYSSPPGAEHRPNPEQFSHLIKLVNSLPGCAIVGGDMNLLPDELEKLLHGPIVRDDCNLPTAGNKRRTKKLDYILGKGNANLQAEVLATRLECPVMFSDHSPVFAEVKFLPEH